MRRVVCVGQVLTDVVAHLPGPLAFGSDVPAPVTFHGGGAGANVAAWLVAAGTSATLVARVGDDAAGRVVTDELAAAGVDLAITVDPVLSTGACIVLVSPDGERTMIPDAGANRGLAALDPDSALPADADLVYVSGYLLLDPASRPFARAVIAAARRRGTPVVVDAASAAPLAGAADEFAGWVGRDVTLLANDDEAEVLCGRRGRHAALALATRFGEAIVKCGADGAFAAGRDGIRHGPAVSVADRIPGHADAVFDTTGAGDAYAAGYLHARLAGGTVDACLESGARLAARAVAMRGGRPSAG